MTLARQPGRGSAAGRGPLRLAPGVLPFFVFVVFRQSPVQRVTALIVIAIVAANLANAALNWMFIFGRFGAGDGVGARLATTASRRCWPSAGPARSAAPRAALSGPLRDLGGRPARPDDLPRPADRLPAALEFGASPASPS
jgi:hypothetical protein